MVNLTLIDFSSLIYAVSYNCSKLDEPENYLLYRNTLDNYVKSILEDTQATHYIAFGDSGSSFRKKLFSDFKGNRKTKDFPGLFTTDLKKYAVVKWNLVTNFELEADDLCLIHQSHAEDLFPGEEVSVVIASKDSDLRQVAGTFFDYGYRRANLTVEQAFETLDAKTAKYNLYKHVLIKGHNDKLDYLEGCGKESAEKYLSAFSESQLAMATLNAFMKGINKNTYGIYKNVIGYGESEGIAKFYNAFTQSYLLRTGLEALKYDPRFDLSKPIKNDNGGDLPL